jgi:hypothetical protein
MSERKKRGIAGDKTICLPIAEGIVGSTVKDAENIPPSSGCG